jgi:hypothetical protein
MHPSQIASLFGLRVLMLVWLLFLSSSQPWSLSKHAKNKRV